MNRPTLSSSHRNPLRDVPAPRDTIPCPPPMSVPKPVGSLENRVDRILYALEVAEGTARFSAALRGMDAGKLVAVAIGTFWRNFYSTPRRKPGRRSRPKYAASAAIEAVRGICRQHDRGRGGLNHQRRRSTGAALPRGACWNLGYGRRVSKMFRGPVGPEAT